MKCSAGKLAILEIGEDINAETGFKGFGVVGYVQEGVISGGRDAVATNQSARQCCPVQHVQTRILLVIAVTAFAVCSKKIDALGSRVCIKIRGSAERRRSKHYCREKQFAWKHCSHRQLIEYFFRGGSHSVNDNSQSFFRAIRKFFERRRPSFVGRESFGDNLFEVVLWSRCKLASGRCPLSSNRCNRTSCAVEQRPTFLRKQQQQALRIHLGYLIVITIMAITTHIGAQSTANILAQAFEFVFDRASSMT